MATKKLVIAVCVLAAALGACASKTAELKAMESFNDANYFYAKGRYDNAQTAYQRILDEQPDNPFRLYALLGVADSYYMTKEYALAIPNYQRFIELYPMDTLTSNALFYQGMSYYMDIKKMERDQTNTELALNTFSTFIEKYPDHSAVSVAKEKIGFLENRLAEKQLYIIEFYYRINSFASCIGRVDGFLEKYPDSALVPRALLFKARAYREEESFEKSREAYKIVAENYKNTPSGRTAASEMKKLPR